MKHWFPALVGFLCQALGMGLVGIFGFFVLPLSREFDVGAATINLAPAFLLIVPALIGPLVGGLVDRGSIRQLMIVGVLIGMGSVYAISLMPSLMAAALCFVGFSVGLSIYGPVTVNALMIKVYHGRVGRALAIAGMGVSFGSMLLPLCAAWLMENQGWRGALQWLAVAIALTLVPAIRLGLAARITGERIPAAGSSPAPATGLGDYLRQRPFWLIGLVIAIVFNVALVMVICYPPHFARLGFTPTHAAAFMAAGGLAGMTGKVIVALVVDRWLRHARMMTVSFLGIEFVGFALLMLSEQFHTIITATAMIGMASGALIPMHPFLNSTYFPPDVIGRINGAQTPLMLPLGLVGAPLAGYAYDVTGSFMPAFAGILTVLGLAIAMLLFLPRARVS